MTTRPTAERTLSCRRAKELEGTDNLVVPFLDLRQRVAAFACLQQKILERWPVMRNQRRIEEVINRRLRRPIEPGELCAVVASANCGAPHAMRGSELPVRPHRGLRLRARCSDGIR